MRVLIIGAGAREHALCWKLARSPRVSQVYAAPGNAGTALEPRVENVPIEADAVEALVEFASAAGVGLTIVGPEAPLVAGVVDAFEAAGLACFGPRAAAAELEGSKAWSKAFMARHGIPTAAFATFRDAAAALAWVRERGAPIVVKAAGLAAGKGVVVARTLHEAEAAVLDFLERRVLGDAGAEVVVEEYLDGEEASYIVIASGQGFVPLASSQDHKARDEGDLGPNTGGMGACSPAPVVTPLVEQRIAREVIAPTLAGLAAEGRPYCGFLYAGLMILRDGSLRVLEYNCRLGDPETQPLLMRLDSDLLELCEAALAGDLAAAVPRWDPRPAVGIVLAAAGYPGQPRRGDLIHGLGTELPAEVCVFHGGTRRDDAGGLRTAGGRVLTVTALGRDLAEAATRAGAVAEGIDWVGRFYRRDIGQRAARREASAGLG